MTILSRTYSEKISNFCQRGSKNIIYCLVFLLGLLYYSTEQINLAKSEFERVVALDENYSNARYFLGLIYDQQESKDKAIEQFEKIEELNPENILIKRILTNLREGLPALEGVQTPQPPIEESPLDKKP